jgi:Protein of unknown function (DUF541)
MSKIHILSVAAAAASLLMGGISQASTSIPQATPVSDATQIAQVVPPVAGLTAIGTGVSTAPADSAVIYLTFYSNYYPQPSEDPNVPPPQPPAATAADTKPVVDAIVATGVPAGNIETTIDPNTSGGFRVKVRVNKPTQASMQALVAAANTAATKNNKYTSGGAQIGYLTNNCQALETEARKLALADARNRSTALATLAGVQLGGIISLLDASSWGYYGGPACPSASDPLVTQDPYSLPSVDLLSPAVVRVNSSVTVTYELK